ncbi:MAG: PIN domain-containing protein [Methermicoccaceae archaeon]
MSYIVLDTSILMTPFLHGVDILSELFRLGFTDPLVPYPVVRELELCSLHKKGKNATAAKIGLKIIAEC